jgi:CheY-like chemotaxis protein
LVEQRTRSAGRASKEDVFDLVLMDIQMPEMDGFEATAAIRESERGTGKHQPIVAMTAHAMKGRRSALLGRRHGWLLRQTDPSAKRSTQLLDGFPGTCSRQAHQ